MKNLLRTRWGRSFVLAVCLGTGINAFSLPSLAQLPVVSLSTTEVAVTMQNPIEQMTWQLASYRDANGNLTTAWSDRPATFRFVAGSVTGTTGCNHFFNAYTLTGDRLTLAPGGSTLMACFPDALAQQETAIFAGMAAIASYDLTGDELRLLDDAGNPVFTLTPQVSASLTGTPWILTAYNNGREALVTPLADTAITATFDEAGNLSGSASCNTYRASFEQSGADLSISTVASTRVLCTEPEGIMQQEQAFLGVLTQVETYSIEGDQLTLHSAEGAVLAQFSTQR